jgi:2,4-dienoyl-CoA reductase-like NADH-dependent reductase (Old Yellow Enzyme family)
MRRGGAAPERCALFVRISATDWAKGGWDIDQSVELARLLLVLGVDVIDCSSGGNLEKADIPMGPGYQTPFAERIRREANIATAAVGLITAPAQADQMRFGAPRARDAPRALLAAPCCARTRPERALAQAVPARGAP